MALQAAAYLLRGESNLPVMARTARLSFIVGFHGDVRRGPSLGFERFVLAVAVQALLTFFNMLIVIERYLPGARIPLLILSLLLEGERRWNLQLCLGETRRRREACEQEARDA